MGWQFEIECEYKINPELLRQTLLNIAGMVRFSDDIFEMSDGSVFRVNCEFNRPRQSEFYGIYINTCVEGDISKSINSAPSLYLMAFTIMNITDGDVAVCSQVHNVLALRRNNITYISAEEWDFISCPPCPKNCIFMDSISLMSPNKLGRN